MHHGWLSQTMCFGTQWEIIYAKWKSLKCIVPEVKKCIYVSKRNCWVICNRIFHRLFFISKREGKNYPVFVTISKSVFTKSFLGDSKSLHYTNFTHTHCGLTPVGSSALHSCFLIPLQWMGERNERVKKMWVTFSLVGKAKAFALNSKKARDSVTDAHQGVRATSHTLWKEKYYYDIYCDWTKVTLQKGQNKVGNCGCFY